MKVFGRCLWEFARTIGRAVRSAGDGLVFEGSLMRSPTTKVSGLASVSSDVDMELVPDSGNHPKSRFRVAWERISVGWLRTAFDGVWLEVAVGCSFAVSVWEY